MVGISFVSLLCGYLIACAADWHDAPSFIAVPVSLYDKLFVNTRNGLFEGFFYVAAGAFLGMRYKSLDSIPAPGLLVGFVLGVAGCVFINADAHLLFCACAGICLFLLSVKRYGTDCVPHVVARNASTVIYLAHMMFAVVFVYGICGGANPDIHANDADRVLLYLFSLGGSALLAAAVIPLSRKLPVLRRAFGFLQQRI